MGRRDQDEESVVTVSFDDDHPRSKSGKPLSEKKLRQLAAARDKALLKRRQKLKSKLEAKLSELRQILGPDNRPDIERVAHMLLKQEETLRSKQNALVLEVKDVITDFKADLQAIKERLSKPTSHTLSSQLYQSLQKPRPRPISEASSTGSGRTITIAT
jgi:exonuclease VII large subunit